MQPDFIKVAAALRNEYLLKTEAVFLAQKREWFADFGRHFQSTCDSGLY